MSTGITPTVTELIERLAAVTRAVRSSEEPVTEKQWVGFESNLHRALTGLLGHHAARVPRTHPARNVLRQVVDGYPAPPPPPPGCSWHRRR